ncbi:MAG: hypothetical protein RH917_16275 [Lacipirellulaceae bacterium]
MKFLQALTCIGVLLVASSAQAQTGITSFIDGFDGGTPAPTVFHQTVAGDFEDGDGDTDVERQGWRPVRMANLESFGGALTNRNGGGFGTNTTGEGDNYIRLDTDRTTALPGVPDNFVVGELPGQFNVFQFDLRYDQFPPEDPNNPGSGLIEPRLKGAAFFQGAVTRSANFLSNSGLQALKDANDTSFHTYTIVRDFNSSDWGAVQDVLRVDPADGISRFDAVGTSAVLGTKFTIDNIVLGRTTSTEAFPAIPVSVQNIVKNGDVSAVSNAVFTVDRPDTFDITGGNGNYGPFRGSSGDVDHWTPYNNNPNGIVEAVNGPDGTGLNLTHSTLGIQGSWYLDTHWNGGTEQFSLNSAAGYVNGMMQADILNGVTIDAGKTYELRFDLDFLDRPSANPNTTFTVALTTGADPTDLGSTVTGGVFSQNVGLLTTGDTHTLSISGADLLAAQNGSNPVNLVLQTVNTTGIFGFPNGTVVPDDHRDPQTVTQMNPDNFFLGQVFTPQAGDVNKDGVVTQADVNLATDYLNGNGGETAAKRQNDLANAPSAPFASEILASLNLTDFDLTGDDFFDQADVDAIAALVTTSPGDFDGNGDFDGADFLGLQQTDASQIPDWEASYGTSSTVASNAAVPEPTSLALVAFLSFTVVTTSGRLRS